MLALLVGVLAVVAWLGPVSVYRDLLSGWALWATWPGVALIMMAGQLGLGLHRRAGHREAFIAQVTSFARLASGSG